MIELSPGELKELNVAMQPKAAPPPVEIGYITGHIANKITGAKIANATIYLDWALDCHSDANGVYTTSYVGYGTHTLLVTADNYVQEEFQVTIDSQTKILDLQLSPVPVTPPGFDWIENMSVDKIVLTPATVYPGQEVEIEIRTKYCPGPLHFDITGRVHIDGVTLEETFRLDYYNPWYYFHYTPQFPGLYTISSGGSSTTLTVLREEHANYYSPFSGVKWPLVTDIVFPDVPPFTIESQGAYYDFPLKEYPWVFPGGDLKFSDILSCVSYWGPITVNGDWIPSPATWFAICPPFDGILSSRLASARPAATDMAECPLDKYEMQLSMSGVGLPVHYYPVIFMMITDKQGCGDCWDSKEALAQMIGRKDPTNIAQESYPANPPGIPKWTLCRACNGTGSLVIPYVGTLQCWYCLGRGKIWAFDIYKGIKDWVYPPWVVYDRYYGRKQKHYYIPCPYCRSPFETGDLGEVSWHEEEKIAWAREFLAHIEQSHPSHPLTEPAWF